MQAAVPLYENEFFPWGGLPYPCEHAKLGVELINAGEVERARRMALYQQATLDHHKKPIYSLFQQEGGERYAELEEANRSFFDTLAYEPEEEYHFVDSELGIVSHRTHDKTVVCLASGCKSGMGVFLVRNGGVLNFGPQLHPLGACSGFGLAGRGQHIKASDNALSYQCRLAAPHERDTGIPWLEDSGYSATWVESACTVDSDLLRISCSLEGFRPLSDLLFTFFIKADACFIAGSHKLIPRSLDRYRGPAQSIQIDGLTLSFEEGFHALEVIPLAGDGNFWGADFMVSLTLLNKFFNFSMQTS